MVLNASLNPSLNPYSFFSSLTSTTAHHLRKTGIYFLVKSHMKYFLKCISPHFEKREAERSQ